MVAPDLQAIQTAYLLADQTILMFATDFLKLVLMVVRKFQLVEQEQTIHQQAG
jgi:hypothetical protein